MMQPDHPLYKFRFCPVCGAEGFAEHGPNARQCASCGLTYYTNPRGATVAVIVNDRGKMLTGWRRNEPARGTRDLVGGFIDLDETAEEGMCREIKEESGMDIRPEDLRYLFSQPNRYPYSGIVCRSIDLFFEVRVKGRPIAEAGDDIGHLEWIPLKDFPIGEFGLDSVRRGLSRYLSLLLTQ